MLVNKLRLKAQITRAADGAPGVLHDKTVEQLKEYRYQLTDVTDYAISFSGRNSSRIEFARWSGTKLDEGRIEIDNSGNTAIIKLTYFIHYEDFIFASGILLLYMCVVDLFAGFALAFLLAGLFFRISLQKGAAKELMEVILK